MNRHSEKWKLPFRMPNGINGILGDPKEREQRYRKLYGKEDWEACSLQDQMELKHRFRILLIGFFAAFLICVCISSERIPVDELVRPKPGEESSSETLYLTGSFDGLSVTKELFVTVEPRQLTEKELRDKLGEYAESLPQRMLGENRSLTEVDRDLIFPETDETGEIIVRWFTDRPDLLSEEGTLYRFRAEGGETITVTAELRLGSLEREETFQITLKKAETA